MNRGMILRVRVCVCVGRRTLTYEMVLEELERKGISIRVASPKLVMEEAPESYKDVSAVVDTCAWPAKRR